MSAYMIVHVTVSDMEKFKAYSEAAKATLKTYGAELLFKGKVADVLTGEHDYKMSAVMKFPNDSSITEWYNSIDYQALIPLRDSAADIVLVGIEELLN